MDDMSEYIINKKSLVVDRVRNKIHPTEVTAEDTTVEEMIREGTHSDVVVELF